MAADRSSLPGTCKDNVSEKVGIPRSLPPHPPHIHPLPVPDHAATYCSPKLVMEEAPESYKDVDDVIETCHQAGISKKAVKLRPIAVIKG